MRQPFSSRRTSTVRRAAFVAGLAVVVTAGLGFAPAAEGSDSNSTSRPIVLVASSSTAPVARHRVHVAAVHAVGVAAVAVAPRATVFATGNSRLDALLATLPPVLFQAGAHVHFGYNPVDCCHAGGYNPAPNDVWVSVKAMTSTARLTYVTVHELAHSIHLRTTRGPALSAAVAGAPSVRPGSPWDVSEKVADCVAWALYPAQTAASGITYWNCPDPWRSQVRAALADPRIAARVASVAASGALQSEG